MEAVRAAAAEASVPGQPGSEAAAASAERPAAGSPPTGEPSAEPGTRKPFPGLSDLASALPQIEPETAIVKEETMSDDEGATPGVAAAVVMPEAPVSEGGAILTPPEDSEQIADTAPTRKAKDVSGQPD